MAGDDSAGFGTATTTADGGGGGGGWRHRYVVFFHLFFRSAAVLSYIFCTLFSSNFIMNFIVIITLLGLDFWTVKNVSGRFLVGLRWWNTIDDEGKSTWRFESRKGGEAPLPAEERVFWWSLYIFALVWIIFVILDVFKLSLSYLIIGAIATSLNISNVIGYRKCQKAKRKGGDVAGSYIESRIGDSITGAVTSQLLRSATTTLGGGSQQRPQSTA